MSVPSEIHELVERFERNCEWYRSGRFNETQVRVDFIDPLMGLLGWDIHNRQGQPDSERAGVDQRRRRDHASGIRSFVRGVVHRS